MQQHSTCTFPDRFHILCGTIASASVGKVVIDDSVVFPMEVLDSTIETPSHARKVHGLDYNRLPLDSNEAGCMAADDRGTEEDDWGDS